MLGQEQWWIAICSGDVAYPWDKAKGNIFHAYKCGFRCNEGHMSSVLNKLHVVQSEIESTPDV